MPVSMDDIVGSWPDVMQRTGSLEKKTCPQLMLQTQEAQTQIKDLQRHVGMPHAFSTSAKLAFRDDQPGGLAASHKGEGTMPIPSAPPPSNPAMPAPPGPPLPAPSPTEAPIPPSLTASMADGAPMHRPPPSALAMDFEALEEAESHASPVRITAPEHHAFGSVGIPPPMPTPKLMDHITALDAQHFELTAKLKTLMIQIHADKIEIQSQNCATEQKLENLTGRCCKLIDVTTEIAENAEQLKIFQHARQPLPLCVAQGKQHWRAICL